MTISRQTALRTWFGAALLAAACIFMGCGTSTTIGPASGSGAPVAITTSALPNGQVGTAYSATLQASGGTAPYKWALTSGSLPAGLTLNATSGAISGMPTAATKAAALTFTVTDSSSPGQTQSARLTITIGAASGSGTPLAITTTTLPNGQVGTAYRATLAAGGGTAPYKWALSSGTLPAGLTLNAASGAISGTPTAATNAVALTFTVTDSSSPAQTQSARLTITIGAASGSGSSLAITTTTLPNGQVGTAYSATLAASGGTAPYKWALTGGKLPAGLALNAASGAISGTPTAAADGAALAFTVTDSSSPAQTRSVSLTMTIAAAAASVTPVVISTRSLPDGQVNAAYTAILSATGGTAPYTWALSAGALPAGLTLNPATGAIGGTPTTAANGDTLRVRVTDSSQPAQTTSVALTITVDQAKTAAPLVIGTTALPNGQVGVVYSATLSATGGTTPYTWALSGGSLPAGLTLNPATGTISGSPTAAVNGDTVGVRVTDASRPAQTISAVLTITIAAAKAATPLTIGTAALPDGQVGAAYGATLSATGGTTPYTWSLSGGALPAGLRLNAATGTISGTPTATANAAPLRLTVTDTSQPAQSTSVSLAMTITAATAPLSVTTTTLPNGQVGTAYNAPLAASGGTAPYTWRITGGALPAGLTLNAATGVISGTPAAAATGADFTLEVTDSSTPAQSKSVSLAMTIAGSGITVAVSPSRAAVTVTEALSLTATTNDAAGVKWTASGASCSGSACGTFSSPTSLNGGSLSWTAPSSAGLYTLTATSATDSSEAASVAVAVTDLSGVLTYHNDLSRSGANTQEYALTPANVNASTFGKLFSCAVDAAIYAQPLWVPNLTIAGATHNVIFVATEADSLYAFDADANTSPCTPLWHVNLLDAAHGGTAGETPVPDYGYGAVIGKGYFDISPEVGVTGTPVIDPATGTLYLVSKSMTAAGPSFYQRLHAIDLTTGNEKFSGPATIAATYPGSGDGGTTVTFSARTENQRAGLVLSNGVVYIAWGSHEDAPPYYGWVMGYNASNLSQVSAFNAAPNAQQAGIWMGAGAPPVDAAGNLYVITGNGNFDAANTSPPTNDYGDTLLQLSSTLKVNQYFTPSDQGTLNNNDGDFGSGGAVVLADLPPNGTNPTHLLIGGGKDGALYVLNRDALGGYGDSGAWQKLNVGSRIFGVGAFWNSTYYLAPGGGPLQAFSLSAATAQLTPLPASTPISFPFPGASPSISSMPDLSNGIVWVIDNSQYCTAQSAGCGPAVLHAYDAANLANELWNSTQSTGNNAGNAVKFTVPTIANGRVYIGTRGNNAGGLENSTSVPGELDVFGLLPN